MSDTAHVLHIVYYDPFDADEEAHVTQRWVEMGKDAAQIATLYERMRWWRDHCSEMSRSPSDIPDYNYYPDMWHAANGAGLTAMGCAIVRMYMREYWHMQRAQVAELHYLLPKEATKLIEGIRKRMSEVNGEKVTA